METALSTGIVKKVSVAGNALAARAAYAGRMPVLSGPKSKRPSRVFLKEWREAKHLSQDQLAGRMDTSKSVVSKLENGRQRYSQDWLEAYAFALGVEVPQLFRHPEAPTPDELLARMTPDQQKQAVAVLETLLKTGT